MEKETKPKPFGPCEKIFKALSIGPFARHIRRITSTSATTVTTPTTTVVDRPIEIEEAPPKHNHTSSPPPPPPLPPQPLQPWIRAPPPTLEQENMGSTQVKKEKVGPMGPIGQAPQKKKDDNRAKVEDPIIRPPAPPVALQAAAPMVEPPVAPPTGARKEPLQSLPTNRFEEYLVRARKAIRTTTNIGGEKKQAPVARPMGARKEPLQSLPTSRFEEYLVRAKKAIRTTTNIGGEKKQEPHKSSK